MDGWLVGWLVGGFVVSFAWEKKDLWVHQKELLGIFYTL